MCYHLYLRLITAMKNTTTKLRFRICDSHYPDQASLKLQKPLYLLMLAIICVSCAHQPAPAGPTGACAQILEQLRSRRIAMNSMEADVKFSFPPGTFITASLEGHAAYELANDNPRLRLAAVGPLGAISLDILVEKSDFWVRLPGHVDPLNQKDLCAIYGDGTLIRTPSVLAKRPGLFFGGIPDGVGEGWSFIEDGDGMWLLPPDEKETRYLVEGNPAVIKKAFLHEKGIGALVVELDQWANSPSGPIPTRINTKFDGRVLFNLKVRNFSFGSTLPDSVFIMKRGKRPDGP